MALESKDCLYLEACLFFGNGDFQAGRDLFLLLAMRLDIARKKHPVFAEGKYHALGVIGEEFRELDHAIHKESEKRQREEALDTIVTLIRFINGEHRVEGARE